LLENEGLVSLRPNVGARVAGLSVAELSEVYLMRERLEPFALAESVPFLSDEEIERIAGYVEEMERIAETGDKWGWFEIDRKFHLATFAAAPMPQLLRIIAGFWNVAQRYRRAHTALLFPTKLSIQHSEHRLLLNTIERRDPHDAEALLGMHIRRTRRELSEHPELFDR
jgi:DNA-binding GntR family transcriptional regulator